MKLILLQSINLKIRRNDLLWAVQPQADHAKRLAENMMMVIKMV